MNAEALQRNIETLNYNLGTDIVSALKNDNVCEIMVNDDGKLWIEEFGKPMQCIGLMDSHKTKMVINTVASSLEVLATTQCPAVEGILPLYLARFEGLIPPIVSQPCFTIRKQAIKVFTFKEYVESAIMPQQVQDLLEDAITSNKNILVVGGTGSGKTTFANAIIESMSKQCPNDRIIIMQDTPELQCMSLNKLLLQTSFYIDMTGLLKYVMRLRPDRIIVGEVRSGEALALLKGWNTGHPGGIATVHANSAFAGLTRLEQLIAEVTPAPMRTLIGEAVDIVVNISKTPEGRRIKEVINVEGYSNLNKQYECQTLYKLAA